MIHMKQSGETQPKKKKRRLRKAFTAVAVTVAVPTAALTLPGISDYTQPAAIHVLVSQNVFPGLPGELSSHFNSKAPAQVPDKWSNFLHATPYYKYDSIQGVEQAAEMGADRAIDLDWHVTRDGVIVNTHGDKPLESGFYDPLKLVPRDKTVEQMTWQEVQRLRAPGGYAIQRAETMFALAAKLGVRIEFEAKNSKAFENVKTWQQVRKLAEENGLMARGLIQMKTLSTIPGAPARLAAAHAAGFTTILLPRGSRELPGKDYWPVTDYVRGPVWWK